MNKLAFQFLSIVLPYFGSFAQVKFPSSKLVLPLAFRENKSFLAGRTWQEEKYFQESSISGGLNFDKFEVTEVDKTGKYTHVASYPSLSSFGSESNVSKTTYCYCDGALVVINKVNYTTKNAGGIIGSLVSIANDGTQSKTSFVYEKYRTSVKNGCYSQIATKPNPADISKAENLFNKALKIPNNSSNERLEKIKLLDEAINLNLNVGKYQYEKGMACFIEGLPFESNICFQNSILLEFQSDLSYYYKGRALHNLMEFKQASVAFDIATKINPSLIDAWYYLGASSYSYGAYSDALRAFRQYQSFKPTNEDYLYNITVYTSKILNSKPFNNN